jgi:hypothetical protein
MFLGPHRLFCQLIGLVQELAEGRDHQVGGFLGQEVAGGQGLAADVDGVVLPDAERLVAAADEALGPPTAQLTVRPSTSTRWYSKSDDSMISLTPGPA